MLKAHVLALLWATVVMVLCVVPADALPPIDFWELNLEDKIAHMGVFGLLAVLMVYGELSRRNSYTLSRGTLLVVMVVVIVYGSLTEFIQGQFIPTRYASFSDLLADAIGGILGTIVAIPLLKITGMVKR